MFFISASNLFEFSVMNWLWVGKLINFMMKSMYYYQRIMGIVTFSLRSCSQIRRLEKSAKRYQKFAALSLIIFLTLMQIKVFIRMYSVKSIVAMGVALFVPAFIYMFAASLLVVFFTWRQLRQPDQLYIIIKDFLRLKKEALHLVAQTRVIERYRLYKDYHYKIFILFSLIIFQHLIFNTATIINFILEGLTVNIFLSGIVTSLIVDTSVISSFTMLFTIFLTCDAIFDKLAYLQMEFYRFSDIRHMEMKKTCRRLLLRYALWVKSFNQYCTPFIFLLYAIVFVESLGYFYCVLINFYNADAVEDSLNIWSAVTNVLLPFFTNIMAEKCGRTFRLAVDVITRISIGQKRRFHIDEHLLELEGKDMKFSCGNIFQINRSLTLLFYAEIVSYFIIFIQYDMGT